MRQFIIRPFLLLPLAATLGTILLKLTYNTNYYDIPIQTIYNTIRRAGGGAGSSSTNIRRGGTNKDHRTTGHIQIHQSRNELQEEQSLTTASTKQNNNNNNKDDDGESFFNINQWSVDEKQDMMQSIQKLFNLSSSIHWETMHEQFAQQYTYDYDGMADDDDVHHGYYEDYLTDVEDSVAKELNEDLMENGAHYYGAVAFGSSSSSSSSSYDGGELLDPHSDYNNGNDRIGNEHMEDPQTRRLTPVWRKKRGGKSIKGKKSGKSGKYGGKSAKYGKQTRNPKDSPTVSLTDDPSTSQYLTDDPTSSPSANPTDRPTPLPTRDTTTDRPTFLPTRDPTKRPTPLPPSSTSPVTSDTSGPSNEPSSIPSTRPSSEPSSVPSRRPSSTPSNEPSSVPSRRPSSAPTTSTPITRPFSKLSFVDVYKYKTGSCPEAGSLGVPCAEELNLRKVCDKYDKYGSFRRCWESCKPSFCCIHDADPSLNPDAASCSADENCAQYAYCYIVWWKFHDTIGPAIYVRLEQASDDFFDVKTEEVRENVTAWNDPVDKPFYDQLFKHHWDNISYIIENSTGDGIFDHHAVFDSKRLWDKSV